MGRWTFVSVPFAYARIVCECVPLIDSLRLWPMLFSLPPSSSLCYALLCCLSAMLCCAMLCSLSLTHTHTDVCLSLLQVVMAVAAIYWHLAPRAEVGRVVKPLVRLLGVHREIDYVVLANIATMAAERPVRCIDYITYVYVCGVCLCVYVCEYECPSLCVCGMFVCMSLWVCVSLLAHAHAYVGCLVSLLYTHRHSLSLI